MWLFILGVVIAVLAMIGAAQERAEQERRVRALQISDVDNMDGIDFEHYVCRLLRHMGFSADVTQASNDFGVDIIASDQGRKIAVQVKRYRNKVSRTAISDAVAGKAHYGCDHAMVVTNSYFTKSAIEFAESTGCDLIDRDALANHILDFQGAGVVTDSDEANNCRDISNVEHVPTDDRLVEYAAHLAAGSDHVTAAAASDLFNDQNNTTIRNPAIPETVMDAIVQNAAAEWPDDYSMQQYKIDEQLTAYRELTDYANPGIPPHILSRVREIAATEWPDDYSMQKYRVEEQVSAYLAIQELAGVGTR